MTKKKKNDEEMEKERKEVKRKKKEYEELIEKINSKNIKRKNKCWLIKSFCFQLVVSKTFLKFIES